MQPGPRGAQKSSRPPGRTAAMLAAEVAQGLGRHVDAAEGEDDGLILWMLSLAPLQRLEAAQSFADSVVALRNAGPLQGISVKPNSADLNRL